VSEEFSLVQAMPLMEPGRTLWNVVFAVINLCLLAIWPFLVAYVLLVDGGNSADALSGLPGISEGGGYGSGAVGFVLTAIPVWGGLSVLSGTAPGVVNVVVLLVPAMAYVLLVGHFVLDAIGSYRGWWTLYRSDTDSLLSLSPGPVQVTGRAQAVEGTVETPYTGTETLVYESEHQQYKVPDNDRNRDSQTHHDEGLDIDTKQWLTVDSDEGAVPFELRGDGGTALVDPTEARLALGENYREGADEERRIERRVDPGETVYVSGVAVLASELDRETHGYDYVVTEPQSDLSAPIRRLRHIPFTLSNDDEAAARGDLLRRALQLTVLSLIVMVPVLVGIFGPVLAQVL